MLEQQGVTVVVREGQLLAGPLAALDDDARELIRRHRPAMLALLTRERDPANLRLALDYFERQCAAPAVDPALAELAALADWFRAALEEWRLPAMAFVLTYGRTTDGRPVPALTVDDPARCYAYYASRLDETHVDRGVLDFLRRLRAHVEGG